MINRNPSAEIRAGSPYRGYLYGYPHKSSYRPLDPAVPLETVWLSERRDALSLYLHIPFCEMRCAFCNLFTTARPTTTGVRAYLEAARRQARRVRQALAPARFVRFAIGGGTPTLLEPAQLDTVFDIAERIMGVELGHIPVSLEVSPLTVTADKLRVARARGVDRVSIGVQSFIEGEARALHRLERAADVESALELLRLAGFPTINIDLMYGLPGQTALSWESSLRAALGHRPEELYLYPLYVRPLTTLGRRERSWDDQRLDLYRQGRDLLLAAGYTQLSMRMFRAPHAQSSEGPVYCCQQDGMVGLGAGARSYTAALHYSSEYAVSAPAVSEILDAWVRRPESSFGVADYGVRLDLGEQRRRFVILSLLSDGVDLTAYRSRFRSEATLDLPELGDLETLDLARREGERIRLTPFGVERSDAIGPWLQSPKVEQLMASYALR